MPAHLLQLSKRHSIFVDCNWVAYGWGFNPQMTLGWDPKIYSNTPPYPQELEQWNLDQDMTLPWPDSGGPENSSAFFSIPILTQQARAMAGKFCLPYRHLPRTCRGSRLGRHIGSRITNKCNVVTSFKQPPMGAKAVNRVSIVYIFCIFIVSNDCKMSWHRIQSLPFRTG